MMTSDSSVFGSMVMTAHRLHHPATTPPSPIDREEAHYKIMILLTRGYYHRGTRSNTM